MQTKTNLEVIIVTIATFLLLLSVNTSYASNIDGKQLRTAYGLETLQYSSVPKHSKVSYSKPYSSQYYGFKSNRNDYRGKRYYQSNRFYNKRYRYFSPRNKYNYRNQYKNRFRYYR